MKRYVPLIVTLLSLACGNEPTSPTTLMPPAATRPPGATPLPPHPSRFVSLWGIVVDLRYVRVIPDYSLWSIAKPLCKQSGFP